MKVNELIKMLKTMPMDLEVKYDSESLYLDVDSVHIIEKDMGYDKDNPRFVLLD